MSDEKKKFEFPQEYLDYLDSLAEWIRKQKEVWLSVPEEYKTEEEDDG